MFSAMLLVISILALAQFGLYYWRSVLAGVAAQPVSGRVLEAAHVRSGTVSATDFDTFAGLHDLTPDLQPNASNLSTVRFYVRVIEALDSLFGSAMPALAAWSQRERAVCARYVAVQIDRRLQANLELAAALRSC
jgi:hypothetical protein